MLPSNSIPYSWSSKIVRMSSATKSKVIREPWKPTPANTPTSPFFVICSFCFPSATLLLQNRSQMGRVAGQNIVLSRIHWTMAEGFVAVNVGYFTRFRLQQRPKLLTWQRLHLKRKIWSQALIAAAPLLMHAGIWRQMSLYSDLWGLEPSDARKRKTFRLTSRGLCTLTLFTQVDAWIICSFLAGLQASTQTFSIAMWSDKIHHFLVKYKLFTIFPTQRIVKQTNKIEFL